MGLVSAPDLASHGLTFIVGLETQEAQSSTVGWAPTAETQGVRGGVLLTLLAPPSFPLSR